MPKELKTIYEISADELEYRMLKQQEMHNEPCQKAVQILESALESVLKSLGVNVEADEETIALQLDNMGIYVNSVDDERMPKAMGIYVSVTVGKDIIPYAWVGDARLNSDGRCFCDVMWFTKNKMDETGGVRLIK
jgi:hypothetical protein